jgi:hypothetical protein
MSRNPPLQARILWAVDVVEGFDLLDSFFEVLDCKLEKAEA